MPGSTRAVPSPLWSHPTTVPIVTVQKRHNLLAAITPEQAADMHAFIRSRLESLLGPTVGAAVDILYGGSMKPDNAADLLARPHVNGGLIGGASLKPDAFAAIVAAAVEVVRSA